MTELTESYRGKFRHDAPSDPSEDRTQNGQLNSSGKVIGGRSAPNTNSHIEFLWSPTGNFRPSNPYDMVADVTPRA